MVTPATPLAFLRQTLPVYEVHPDGEQFRFAVAPGQWGEWISFSGASEFIARLSAVESAVASVVAATAPLVTQTLNITGTAATIDGNGGSDVVINLANASTATLALINPPAVGKRVYYCEVRQDAVGNRKLLAPSGWRSAGAFQPMIDLLPNAISIIYIEARASTVTVSQGPTGIKTIP